MTVHVTIPVDESEKAELDAWASASGVPVYAMLAEAVSLYVAEQREMQAAIAEAEASIAAGEGIPHEEVVARLRARRADWMTSP